ncbi:MAG TPA: hypothetical protein VMJ10_19330 [Kofleriaceae bacterium]|nr:hypothetical protein [Kofleriaceae bacterium]
MMRITIALACALAAAAVACGSSTSGGSGGSPDAYTPRCGDGVCDSSEVDSCPQDCGTQQQHATCGNGVCEPGETAATCPSDCGSGSGSAVCGDGICEQGEDATSCPQDCGSGSGSGVLDCSDETVLEECIDCLIVDPTTCMGDINATNCAVCLGV